MKIAQKIIKPFTSAGLIEKICLPMGIFLTIWYGWILDDAYVYFRYVDNLVIHNLGLVYNPGEYVEGFSSPLWTGILIILRSLHLNYWFIILLIGVMSYVLFWYLVKEINDHFSGNFTRRFNFPLLYLTCTYGVMSYFTSGLETPLVILESAGYVALILFPSNIWLQIFVGLSPLVRPELALPYLVIFVWIVVKHKRIPLPLLLTGLIAVGGYELFRIWYYADFFPNTFYLKNITWITQGLAYLYDTILAYQTIPVIGILVIVYLVLRRKYGPALLLEKERIIMLISVCLILFYVIKIGGDPRHFRLLAFPFCLAIIASAGIIEGALQSVSKQMLYAFNIAGIILMVLFLFNFPRQLQSPPLFRSLNFSHSTFMNINDAATHRFNEKNLTPPLGSLNPQSLSYSGAVTRYHQQTQDIIADSWCQTAYLKPKSFVIQSLGLTEPILARTLMKSDRPAHKLGLKPLAQQILKIRNLYGFRQGAFVDAIDDGVAPNWMIRNIQSIEMIEAKVYNHHIFGDNLRMALTHIESIKP